MLRLFDLVAGESDCPRVAYAYRPWHVRLLPFRRKRWFNRNPPVACGLLWQHDGPCVQLVPGDYLPPPLLHPLDMRLVLPAWRCPLCTQNFNSWNAEPVTAFRGCQENWDRVRTEWEWTFQPCGCVGREVPDGHDEAPAVEAGA